MFASIKLVLTLGKVYLQRSGQHSTVMQLFETYKEALKLPREPVIGCQILQPVAKIAHGQLVLSLDGGFL